MTTVAATEPQTAVPLTEAPTTRATPAPGGERITDDEHAYLQTLLAESGAARAALQEAQAQAVGADGAMRSFAAHLTKRYGLRDDDGVRDDGTIHRRAANGG